MRLSLVVVHILLMAACGAVSATEWATLRGRIVYDGTPPIPKRITADKDKEVCGQYDLVDESLVVDPRNRGVKNVIVKLALGRGESTEIHESYKTDETSDVVLNNKHCRFDPHVTAMRTTQRLVIRNSDPIGNNVRIDAVKNTAINITVPTGKTHKQLFPKAERMPARVSCSIHFWELGWLVVTDHPYVAVTDENGRFEIANIPAGSKSFMFWQEKAGYLGEVTIQGAEETWRRGTREFVLLAGDNDLGEIVVRPSLFEH